MEIINGKVKKMIRIALAFMLLFYLSNIDVFGATSTTSGTTMMSFYKMNITLVNQEPSPAEAGRYVAIRFKIENSGRENAEDVMIELLPKYPFSIDPGESAVKSLGSIYSRQTGAVGVIKSYRLKVDEDALEGNNEIKLRYRIKNNEWIELEPFYINVKPHDVLLNIERIDAPKMISPGETSRVEISLKNLALTLIKDVKVKLKLDDVPFATINSTNKQIVEQIDGGSGAIVRFSLMAEPDAKSKLYKVPIEIEFLDRLGTVYAKNETMGLIIGAEPELSIMIESSQVYTRGDTGNIVIKFVNKGVTDVKFLEVALKEVKYDILSPNEVYVGNIDSDDYETAEFKLALKGIKESEAMLPLVVKYKDANNNEYLKDVNLPLKIYSSSEAKALGLKKGNSSIGILIVIAIVAGGIFFYIKWKKKNKGKSIIAGLSSRLPFLEESKGRK